MTKIIAFSDSHSQHQHFKIPECDIAIFAGDANLSSVPGTIQFLDWYKLQPAKTKICVAGNHDFFCQDHSQLFRELCEDRDIIYLEHEACEIDGIKFFGSPYTPVFCNWAFMVPRGLLWRYWKQIPDNTEVLITHGPPKGILDWCPNGNVGCEDLLDRIKELDKKELRHHIFGHIHESNGKKRVGNVTFHNVSVLDGRYKAYGSGMLYGEINI